MTRYEQAVAYARLSQDAAGLGVGVQAQLQDCRALAADRGFQIVREYVDNAQSASDTAPAYRRRRPAYEQLLTDIKAGRVDAVVVLSMERLWRSRTQRAADIELFQRHGVSLLTVRGPDVDLSTATGRLVFSVISELGVFELEQMQERQARAMLRRVESGAPPTGQRCYAYDRSGWQVVEAEAAVVRDVFEQFNAGASLSGLAAQLNQRGIPNRNGKPWTHNAVRVLLGNERYSARRTYQGKTYGGKWPAIVTLDQLLAAQARLADPSRTTSANGTCGLRRGRLREPRRRGREAVPGHERQQGEGPAGIPVRRTREASGTSGARAELVRGIGPAGTAGRHRRGRADGRRRRRGRSAGGSTAGSGGAQGEAGTAERRFRGL
jgi:DNA invertase Pin-like site-specific DNA recombinase